MKQNAATRAQMRSDNIGTEVTDMEVSMWASGPFSEASYATLVTNLVACGCLRSACELCLQLLKKHPHLAHGCVSQADLEKGVQILTEAGQVRRELYPWNNHEPERFAEGNVAMLNAWMSEAAPKLEVRATALPVLGTYTPKIAPPATSKQLGVFAKEDLAPGETILEETCLLTANSRLHGDFCDACSKILPDLELHSTAADNDHEDVVSCEDCDDAVFCSQRCLELAQESYHSAVCGGDVSAIAKDVLIAEASDALYSLLLLRALAMSETQDIHPLDLREVKYIWGDFHSESVSNAFDPRLDDAHGGLPRTLPFSFKYNIMMPLNMLEKMDVNIFDNGGRFDTWVLNTSYAKFRGTASARQGRDGRPDVGAVHPLWCLLNHSCDPQVTWEWEGKMNLWVKHEREQWAGKPKGEKKQAGVQKDEEVMMHYCDVSLDVKERREWAVGALGGFCQCERCIYEEKKNVP